MWFTVLVLVAALPFAYTCTIQVDTSHCNANSEPQSITAETPTVEYGSILNASLQNFNVVVENVGFESSTQVRNLELNVEFMALLPHCSEPSVLVAGPGQVHPNNIVDNTGTQ